MRLFAQLAEWVTNALFPLAPEERELFSYTPNEAWARLNHAAKPPHSKMFSVYSYKDKRVSGLIWNLKYKKSAYAAKICGYAVYRTIMENLAWNGHILLLPIPITVQRLKERGYNQCHLILEEIRKLDKNNDTPNKSHFELSFEQDLLIRIHHDTRHTLKNRKERLESARGIFAVNETTLNNKYEDKNCIVIIIDDVITTGSTSNEAMKTITQAGFEEVYCLSVAH